MSSIGASGQFSRIASVEKSMLIGCLFSVGVAGMSSVRVAGTSSFENSEGLLVRRWSESIESI